MRRIDQEVVLGGDDGARDLQDDRDRLRFWHCYLGTERRGAATRLLAWWVRLKAARYRRHNAKMEALDLTSSRRLSA